MCVCGVDFILNIQFFFFLDIIPAELVAAASDGVGFWQTSTAPSVTSCVLCFAQLRKHIFPFACLAQLGKDTFLLSCNKRTLQSLQLHHAFYAMHSFASTLCYNHCLVFSLSWANFSIHFSLSIWFILLWFLFVKEHAAEVVAIAKKLNETIKLVESVDERLVTLVSRTCLGELPQMVNILTYLHT